MIIAAWWYQEHAFINNVNNTGHRNAIIKFSRCTIWWWPHAWMLAGRYRCSHQKLYSAGSSCGNFEFQFFKTTLPVPFLLHTAEGEHGRTAGLLLLRQDLPAKKKKKAEEESRKFLETANVYFCCACCIRLLYNRTEENVNACPIIAPMKDPCNITKVLWTATDHHGKSR